MWLVIFHVVKMCITFIFIYNTVLYMEGRSYVNITMFHTLLMLQILAYMIAIRCHIFVLITTWFAWPIDFQKQLLYLEEVVVRLVCTLPSPGSTLWNFIGFFVNVVVCRSMHNETHRALIKDALIYFGTTQIKVNTSCWIYHSFCNISQIEITRKNLKFGNSHFWKELKI